ncbi:MAG: acyltransferase [Candidatus Gracilibacteria bacterium]|nr:acyltransferase [Candidatus Gracilibacteria bacterium]
MTYKKIVWSLRMLVLSLLYKDIKMPGYIGMPILMTGLKNIKLAPYVRILPNSRLEVYGTGTIDIKANVSIGQGLHITSQGSLIINSGTVISGNVVITNIDHQYEDISKPVLEQPHDVKETIIGKNCFIGYGAVIQAGTKLGRHCVVGANSVVRGEYPDFSVIAGVPAKIIKRFDTTTNTWLRIN